MPNKLRCYRVWMKDGYASLQDAASDQEARDKAIAGAKETIKDAAMTAKDKRDATTVDRCYPLDR
jgi:hypothetical protein